MVKLYICIGIFLVTTWVIMWFVVKGIFRSLDQGEDSKLARMFLPKDYARNLEMAERQAQRKKREAERARKAAETEKTEITEDITEEKEEE